MRGRDAPEIQAIGQLCGNLVALGAGLYVVWSTAVAFAGGTIPLTDVHVHGSVRLGVLWTFVADPVVASVAVVTAYLLVGIATLVVPVTPGEEADGYDDTGPLRGLS